MAYNEDPDGWGSKVFRQEEDRSQADYLPSTAVTFTKMKTTLQENGKVSFEDWEKDLRATMVTHGILDLINMKLPRPTCDDLTKSTNWKKLSTPTALWLWENIGDKIQRKIYTKIGPIPRAFADTLYAEITKQM
ncbi:hypothetical protein N7540_000133 [Penicillium herquei]|nr:hypothetical protein N7540_000133 [Penicillium herquei]